MMLAGATRGRRRHRDVPPTRARRCASSTRSRRGARDTTSRASRDLIGGLQTNAKQSARRRERRPRDHLALALDVADLDAARRASPSGVAPWFGVAKVGFELYAAAGPAAVDALRDKGFRVFATSSCTTSRPRSAGPPGCSGATASTFLNFHAAGGVDMLRAGVEGLAEGARDAGHAAPVALAVTVLTSDPDTSTRSTHACARLATRGCDGVVCSGTRSRVARALGLRTMVPGIRLAGGDAHDQARGRHARRRDRARRRLARDRPRGDRRADDPVNAARRALRAQLPQRSSRRARR